jgi:hypothetical protein
LLVLTVVYDVDAPNELVDARFDALALFRELPPNAAFTRPNLFSHVDEEYGFQ